MKSVSNTWKKTFFKELGEISTDLEKSWDEFGDKTAHEEIQWLFDKGSGAPTKEFVINCILGIRAQTPLVFPPVATVMSLYCKSDHYTLIDKIVLDLVSNNLARKLCTLQLEEAVILVPDYKRIVRKTTGIENSLLEKFLECSLLKYRFGVDVYKRDLIKYLECSQDDIAKLVSKSLLGLHKSPDKFYFSVPGLSGTFSNIRNGLLYLAPLLQHRKPQVLPLEQILLKRTRRCIFPWSLVVAHGSGEGVLSVFKAPSGLMVNLSRKGQIFFTK